MLTLVSSHCNGGRSLETAGDRKIWTAGPICNSLTDQLSCSLPLLEILRMGGAEERWWVAYSGAEVL